MESLIQVYMFLSLLPQPGYLKKTHKIDEVVNQSFLDVSLNGKIVCADTKLPKNGTITANTDDKNHIESSCTAMFAYGIMTAINLGIISDPKYKMSVDAAYNGLRKYSLASYKEKYLKH